MMSHENSIKINGAILKDCIKQHNLKASTISRTVLHERDGYISDCIRNNSIREDHLNTICDYLMISQEKKREMLETSNSKVNDTNTKSNNKEEKIWLYPDKLKDELTKSGITLSKLSTVVLHKSKNYISVSLSNGYLFLSDLNTLCDFLDLKADEYIDKKKMQDEKDQEYKNNIDTEKAKNNSLETLIIGVNLLLEETEKTNSYLKQLAEEMHVQNTKIGRIESKTHTLENALGQLVGKTIQINENEEAGVSALRELKSSAAIINGRTKDILSILESNKSYKKAI